MLQAKKFDSDCKYIKKYVPELKNVPNQHILAPNEYKLDYAGLIVDHLDATKNAKMMYLREN